jgi:hypothetical protein
MASVTVHAKGVYGDANLYEGRLVVVLYYSEFQGWIVEEGVVTDGIVELAGAGPLTGDRYYVGLKYDSLVKTFPLSPNGAISRRSRVSRVDLYMASQCTDLSVEVGNEHGSDEQVVEFPEDFTTGKREINVSTTFGDEPYLQIKASGMDECELLALDVVYKQYEGV